MSLKKIVERISGKLLILDAKKNHTIRHRVSLKQGRERERERTKRIPAIQWDEIAGEVSSAALQRP